MAYPSIWLFIVPPLTLLLQSSLAIHSAAASSSIRLLRLAILPLCVYAILTASDTYCLPARDFIVPNIIIRLVRPWVVMRSIDFASAKRGHSWIGYDAAYAVHGKNNQDAIKTVQRHSHGMLGSINYGWANLCSLRGIGWDWGLPGNRIATPCPDSAAFLSHIIPQVARYQVISVTSFALLTAGRQGYGAGLLLPGGSALHHDLSTLHRTILSYLGRTIFMCAFGSLIFASLELGYSVLSLAVYLFTSLLRTILPRSIAPTTFERRAWPPLMDAPVFSVSLHEFWAKRWHGLFSRPFSFCGAVPIIHSCNALGLGKGVSSTLGPVGVFAMSGILHEALNEASPWLPRDPFFTMFRFFIVQSVGLGLEKLFAKLSKQHVGGKLGWLWTFSWLLVTAKPFAETMVGRGLADFVPPVSQWEIWRWVVPMAFILPSHTNQA